jgi:hypothetical protein
LTRASIRRRETTLWCLLAGTCDAATGALLVAAPLAVARLLRLTPPPTEPVYLRFVGVFVGAVGLAYLYPILRSGARERAQVVAVLELTAGFRFAVASFVMASVVTRALGPAWLVVAATDLGIGALQLALLRSRWRRELSVERMA